MRIKRVLVCKRHRAGPGTCDCSVNFSYYCYLLFHSLCIQNKDVMDEWSEMPSMKDPLKVLVTLTQAPGAAPSKFHCGIGDMSL